MGDGSMPTMKVDRWRHQGDLEQLPFKLYRILELADLRGLGRASDAIAWLPHGRAFVILDERQFMGAVVPLFFKLTKISSFYRQLYVWGFKRVLMGYDAGAWYNKFFLRTRPGEMRKMVKVTAKKKTKSDKKEPDFHTMPPLPPLPGATKSAANGTMGNCPTPRRHASFDDGSRFDCGPTAPLERRSFAAPPDIARPAASSILPMHPNLLHGGDVRWHHEMLGSLVIQSHPPSGATSQNLIRRRKSPTFAVDGDAKRRSAAGTMPLPFDSPAALTPTNDDPGNGSEAGPKPFPTETKVAADELEPLPFRDEVAFDDFANFIGDAFQTL